ncbi:SusC/RagA family TonB-linked outer membrane protein [Gemmatimonas aurantiaca]|uniref:SusC/RagA family TonB-linked outer membrane protein n=1 Tax=Gemmatimonas aurantiaca TaxID=173480 RepID=UPI00301D7D61
MFHRAISRRLVAVGALLVLAAPLHAVQAQTGTITGKVTDAATKLPIADVRVVITGTTFEAQTGRDGEYRLINVRPGPVTVSAFRIGYRLKQDTVRVATGATVTLNLEMTQSVINLSEVVVTGTAGNQERKAQAALVASVTAADVIKDAPVSNIASMLQSRVPGVSLTSQSGTKGTATAIRIRGASSINLSNQPLVFVDGVRLNEAFTGSGQSGQQYDRFNDLNPEEIESIELVKGPAAATLYGADASAGVIQIITKKGRAGSNTFSQNIRLEGGQMDRANGWSPDDNWAVCTAALVASTSTNPLCRGKQVGDLVSDNPLMRVGAFQKGSQRILNWNARGGGSNYGYSLSYGSENSEGILPNNGFNRYNVRTNANYVANSKLNFDVGLGLSQTWAELPTNDNNVYGWLGGGLLGNPTTRNDSPTGQLTPDGWYSNRHYNAINSYKRDMVTKRVVSSITGNYSPVEWFTNRFTVGMDFAADNRREFQPKNDSLWYGGLNDGGNMAQNARNQERYTFDWLGNMKRQWGTDWETNLSFGMQVISSRDQVVAATGIGFVTNDNISINSAATTTGNSTFTEQRQYGYLGQLQIGHMNKRFLQLGVRADRNSSFGSSAPTFILPKVGVSWAIGEEDFFQPLSGLFSTMRLRASYGTTGRSPNPGDAIETLTASAYNITGVTGSGIRLNRPGQPNLKAERGTEFEAGIDAGLFNNRVSTELTYYRKVTKDLIIARPIPPSLGYALNPLANLGSVLNSGLELALNVNALNLQNARWDLRLGANTLHNELTDLGGVPAYAIGGAGRIMEGQQLGVFVTKTVQSIDVANKRVTVADDFVPVGNLLPTMEWNLTNTVTLFKNLRLSAMLDAKRDFMVENNTAFFRETQVPRARNRIDVNALSETEKLRRFGPFFNSKGETVPVNDAKEAYLERGDFVRFRELSATLTLPNSLLKAVGNRVQNASLTFAVQNLKLWTDYTGPDPEVNSQTNAWSRQDFLTLPNPRTAILRLNVSF